MIIIPATDEEVLAVNRAQLELERVFSRLSNRWPTGARCAACGATNALTLGRIRSVPLCWRCRNGHVVEEHSLIGQHLPPRVPTHLNDHKVADEVQRIMTRVIGPGVRTEVAANVSAWMALELAGLGSLREAA
jgi:hypothetical protein